MNIGNLGWAGVGNMGAPMLDRLLRAGHCLTAYDPLPGALADLQRTGDHLTVAPSLAELARCCHTVFLSLPSVAVVRDVAHSLANAPGTKVRLMVNTCTTGASLSVELVSALQPRGLRWVDCPVSGGPEAARTGVLSIMVSGVPEDIEILRPLLLSWGQSIVVAGENPGAAQTLKLVNNAVIVASYVSTLEAFLFGAKSGLEPTVMLDAMNAGRLANNGTTRVLLPDYILKGKDFGAKMHLLMKDMGLAMTESEQLQVPMRVCASALQVAQRACEHRLDTEADLMDLMRALEAESVFTLPRIPE